MSEANPRIFKAKPVTRKTVARNPVTLSQAQQLEDEASRAIAYENDKALARSLHKEALKFYTELSRKGSTATIRQQAQKGRERCARVLGAFEANPLPPTNARFAKMFHGYTRNQTRASVVSKNAAKRLGGNLNRLGSASYVKLLAHATGRHANPAHACAACTIPLAKGVSLVANPRNKQLGFAGQGIFTTGRRLQQQFIKANPQRNPGEIGTLDLGAVDIVNYTTPAKHESEGAAATPVLYYHQTAEETGRVQDKPHLMVDAEGAIYLKGGANDINERGIIN